MKKEALERALITLKGLWIGDCFGSHFEFDSVDWNRPRRAAAKRELPPAPWRYTDDTQMALSIFEELRKNGEIHPSKLAKSFAGYFDISRGYGLGAEQLLINIRNGGDWSELASSMFDGSGSFGNGSAMRVAPIGAYFADDLNKVIENATQSSIVTHTHPNGISVAVAVAVTVALVIQHDTGNEIFNIQQFWKNLISHISSGDLKNRLQHAASLKADTTTSQAAKILGCGWDVSAIDTVPFAIWCAINNMDSFEEAMWQVISVGGDADTTAAIVGGIVANYVGRDGIPQKWLNYCEPLPAWIVDTSS